MTARVRARRALTRNDVLTPDMWLDFVMGPRGEHWAAFSGIEEAAAAWEIFRGEMLADPTVACTPWAAVTFDGMPWLVRSRPGREGV